MENSMNWRWDKYDDLRDENDNAIVEGANYFGDDEDLAISHKNLIAAAPQLLEALKIITLAYDDARAFREGHDILAKARDAVARAEGL